MIVCNSFLGDNNDELKWAQHDLYAKATHIIINRVGQIHDHACLILNCDSKIKKNTGGAIAFDHRNIQAAHDHLAAYWRSISGYSNPKLELKPINEQANEWLNWLNNEVDRWFYFKPLILSAMIEMLAVKDNPRAAQLAGEHIFEAIEDSYSIDE